MLGYTATDEEVNRLVELYNEYDDEFAIPSGTLKGAELDTGLTQAVHDAYALTQKRRKLKHIRETVFSNVELCPVCGIDPPSELDHYLPKSEFKPIAIYIRNLIPLCHACNHLKLTAFSDEAEKRFVHVYLDILPPVQFLRAIVTLQNESLLVNFEINPCGIAAEMNARLSYQLTQLRLNDRYRTEINSYLAGHAVALHIAHRAAGKSGVRSFLSSQARYENGRFHRNHWRPVLLMALAEHDDFCEGGFSDVLPVLPEIIADLMGFVAAA
jgi:hypothetical protein